VINAKSVYVSDANADLISTWTLLSTQCDALVEACRPLFVLENHAKDAYYALRTEFNKTEDKLRKAALFIYLNKHGFNGMCRYNSEGEFNIPVGRYKKVTLDEKRLQQVAAHVQKWTFTHEDFKPVLARLQAGDTCYCDPPYDTDENTKHGVSGFTAYTANSFSSEDQVALADAARAAADRGATVLVSNHATDSIQALYSERKAQITTLQVNRTIAGQAESRRPATELLALFSPIKQ
jgi:DNA adenine methylase